MMQMRFVRFLLVGTLNAGFGYGWFWLLIYVGMNHRLALLFSTVIGILFNFQTTGRIVFQSNNHLHILRFILVYFVVYGVNVIGLDVLMRLGLSAYWAAAAFVLPCALLAFLLQKKYVFRHD